MKQKLVSGIGVWSEQDIANVLRAVDIANRGVAEIVNTQEILLYRHGYEDAIIALASAFGIQYDRLNANNTEWRNSYNDTSVLLRSLRG